MLTQTQNFQEWTRQAPRELPPGRWLQRKCACGRHKASGGSCGPCSKRLDGMLSRKAVASSSVNEVPDVVHEVLRSPGEPLEATARMFFEPRFGKDFSRVRVHTDTSAAKSARAVNALAYSVGNHVVFDAGEYDVQSNDGRRLIAHELTHVVQQEKSPRLSMKSEFSVDETAEREADDVSNQLVRGQPIAPLAASPSAGVMRKLRVEQPQANIPPSPTGAGVVQTNAETVESYLRQLSPDGGVTVDRTSGWVSMATGYCPGLLGGFLQGGRTGYRIGNMIGSVGGHVPLLGPIFGAVGAVIGSVVGGLIGLFGGRSSAAAASATPTGSTCICDLIDSRPVLNIQINDQLGPAGAETLLRIPSPNSQRIWGSTSVSGRLMENAPWEILAHEMCGHSWITHQRIRNEEGPPQDQARMPNEIVWGEPPPGPLRADQNLRHGRTVERENLIRAEHGLEARGHRLRDPYCGESFWRERGVPNAPVHWQAYQGQEFQTYLEQCEFMRSQLPESRNHTYRIDEPIPEQPSPARPGQTIQRKVAGEEHTHRPSDVACQPGSEDQAFGAAAIVADVLNSPGEPLDSSVRSFLEAGFAHHYSPRETTVPSSQRSASGLTIGPANDYFEHEADRFAELVQQPASPGGPGPTSAYDFSGVRVHTDSRAAESARSVDANAFTVGHHLVFGEGQYSPATSGGRKLIAHELTHTIQQTGGPLIQRDATVPSRPPINLFPPNLVPPPPVTPRPSRQIETLPGQPGTAALQHCSASATAPLNKQPAGLQSIIQQSTASLGADVVSWFEKLGATRSALTSIYNRMCQLGIWQRVKTIRYVAAGEKSLGPFDVPGNVGSVGFTTDDGPALMKDLLGTFRFCADSPIGGSQHKEQVSFREVSKSDSLHVAVGPGNKFDAHIDRYSSPEGGGGHVCEYDPASTAAHIGRELIPAKIRSKIGVPGVQVFPEQVGPGVVGGAPRGEETSPSIVGATLRF